jgi:hypothetical protein
MFIFMKYGCLYGFDRGPRSKRFLVSCLFDVSGDSGGP